MHAAVHERAGVALVGVADDVLVVALLDGGEVPLDRGGEAAPAAPAQPRFGDGVDGLLRRHLGEHLDRRLVAADYQILVDALRIDAGAVAQRHPELLVEEVGVSVGGPEAVGQPGCHPVPLTQAIGAGLVAQFHRVLLYGRALHDVRLEDLGGLVGVHQHVLDRGHALGAHGHHRLHVAAAGAAHMAEHHILGAALLDELLQPLVDGRRAGRVLAGGRAHRYADTLAQLLAEQQFLGLAPHREQAFHRFVHEHIPCVGSNTIHDKATNLGSLFYRNGAFLAYVGRLFWGSGVRG